MKQVKLLILLFAAMLFAFSACEKDELTEQEAIQLINDLDDQEFLMQDSVANAVVFTVTIVDATTDVNLKSTQGLAGLNVTASQEGDVLMATTNETGMVVFDNLRLGSVALNIQGENYTTVDLVAGINQNGYYSVIVPVLSTTDANKGTIKGSVTMQSDLTDYDKEPAAGVKIFALLDPNCTFVNNLTTTQGINQVVYSDLVDTTFTGIDGSYTLKLPADAYGSIEYEIYVEDFVYNQTLFMNTVNEQNVVGEGFTAQTIATTFSSNITTPSTIDNVDGVYATLSAPAAKFTQAQAVANIINNNSIVSVNVTKNGSGYYNGTYTLPVDPDNVNNTASVDVKVQNNEVSYIDVNYGGGGYNANNSLNLGYEVDNFRARVNSVDFDGAITSIDIMDNGSYLTRNVTISIDSNNGEDAELTIGNWFTNGDGTQAVSFISIEDGGQDYEVDDDIELIVSVSDVASAEINLSTAQLANIIVTNHGAGYIKNTNFEVELIGGEGQDATARAYTDALGQLYKIEVENVGTGFTSVPNVKIPSFNDDMEVNTISFSDGMIDGISFTNNEVYVQEPLIKFFSQATGNEITDIVYDINLAGTTLNIDITNPGSGYTEGNYPTASEMPDPKQSIKFVSGGTSIHNIHLGTGKRTIEN
jgi:hypothetical protein